MDVYGNIMEELFELRNYIQQGQYSDALILLDEMEEMSKDDKINKIHSYAVILLIHLIKQNAQKRSTRSWENSIENSVEKINMTNKRRKAGGFYIGEEELKDVLSESYKTALRNASLEAFEGIYSASELGQMVDKEDILKQAWKLIFETTRN
ncbi:MAG: DUF29 family protein [Desulfobacteraceae bacterium]|nr:DUF29 family protein [Desulfobacteraceae bacterium]